MNAHRDTLDVRLLAVLIGLALVTAGGTIISLRAFRYPDRLASLAGYKWAAPGFQQMHYVARRDLPANHYLLEGDLEPPKLPASSQVDPPPAGVLQRFLRHDVRKGKPVTELDVAATPFFVRRAPKPDFAFVKIPLYPDTSRLNSVFDVGEVVTITGPGQSQASGQIVAIGVGCALVEVPFRCAAAIAGAKVTEPIAVFATGSIPTENCAPKAGGDTATQQPQPPGAESTTKKKNSTTTNEKKEPS